MEKLVKGGGLVADSQPDQLKANKAWANKVEAVAPQNMAGTAGLQAPTGNAPTPTFGFQQQFPLFGPPTAINSPTKYKFQVFVYHGEDVKEILAERAEILGSVLKFWTGYDLVAAFLDWKDFERTGG